MQRQLDLQTFFFSLPISEARVEEDGEHKQLVLIPLSVNCAISNRLMGNTWVSCVNTKKWRAVKLRNFFLRRIFK